MIATSANYLQRLLGRVSLRFADAEFESAARFAELFWSRIPEEDFLSRDVEDDAGAVVDCWRLFNNRRREEIEIYVGNPVHARDG